jgi:Dullard-like phosphatase family protein
MDNNKKLQKIKNQNQNQCQATNQEQNNNLKQNEQNQNLSELGETTATSSVSSIKKNNQAISNYKTPKKKNYQIPIKKNIKTVSPDLPNKTNKIYTKGIAKKCTAKKDKNQNSNNKNTNNNVPNNTASNNTVINNNNLKNNGKECNKPLGNISIEQKKNNNNLNNNNSSNNNNKNNNNHINNTMNNFQINNKNYLYNNHETKVNQLNNSQNNKNIYFNKKICKKQASHINKNNIYSDEEKERMQTENKINNIGDMSTNQNLENNYYNEFTNNIGTGFMNRPIMNDSDYPFCSGYYSEADQKKEKSAILNIEELLMTEEKLSAVINCIEDGKPCAEECFEWLNSYSQSDLINNIEKFFIKEQFIRIIRISVNFNIFSLMLCYIISLDEIVFSKLSIYLLNIMKNNHRILILISKYFKNRIIDNNIYVERLNQLIINYEPMNKNKLQIINDINCYCNNLMKLLPNILAFYSKPELILIYRELENISSSNLIRIYREKFHRNLNQNGSIFASSAYFRMHKFNGGVPVPFLNTKSNKPYTLVLDLDETLIHFKSNPNNESSGKIMIRPYLYEFLRTIKENYELIIFTAATQDYADPIINAIEKDEKFFDHRLYRMHTTIVDNDFVKDLSKLGRNLKRTIIVDNMKQNYKNQPKNGITIRPFWGKDVDDSALVDLLDILQKIAYEKLDVVYGSEKYKEDIISKVSSNILRRSQNK